MAISSITQYRLKELLNYDPETGVFIWLVNIKRVKAGDIAGVINGCGYRVIGVDGVLHSAHRLVFLYLYGSFPPDQVDHIDGDPANNRRVNLRRCDAETNRKNMCLSTANTSGFIGVSWCKQTGKWRSSIKVKCKYKHLGRFTDKKDAISARKVAMLKYGYHENHGRKA